jgi:glycosyltransferase involved in cell wall biosynthesis
MRIVHLTWGLGVGGAEAMLGDIAAAHAAAHDTWIIVCNRDIDESIAAGIEPPVRRLSLGRPRGSANPWYLVKLILWLWRLRPDVVHVHQDSFARLKFWIRAPLVLTVHNTQLGLRGGLEAFESVCCISEAVRRDVISRFHGCRPRVIGNGINFAAVRRKTRYGGSSFQIVQVSRLAHGQKGQDVLIRALRRVLDDLGTEAARVDFIGEGESRPYLEGLCVEHGVQAHCRFLGVASRRAIYAMLHEYDLLVQPSRYEGFGLSVIEGIAAGVPVLVSDIEGPKEIVADGTLGWCFQAGDAQDLARHIIELIALSRRPGFAEQMRTRADAAKSRFDVRLTAQNYVDEYLRVERRGRSGALEGLR